MSPLLRAHQTSTDIIKSTPELSSIIVTENPLLLERKFGEIATTYPVIEIYLATHPVELRKFFQKKDTYVFPGGESKKEFQRRVTKTIHSMRTAKQYEGQTTVFIEHAEVEKEQLRQLTKWMGPFSFFRPGLTVNVATGSVTVVESTREIFGERRFTVVAHNQNFG